MGARPAFDNLFIGAGAMKAGTTWLYSVLDLHPEIFFSLEKEIHYFYARSVDRRVLRDEVRLDNVQKKYLQIDPANSHPEAVRKRLRWSAAYLDGPLDDDWYRGLFMFRRDETYMADFPTYTRFFRRRRGRILRVGLNGCGSSIRCAIR